MTYKKKSEVYISTHIKDGWQWSRSVHVRKQASSSMHQTGAIHVPGQCVDWACHVINSCLDLLYLIKAIPSGEQTSLSVWNQAKEGRWPNCHPQLEQWGLGVHAQCSNFVVSLILDPLMSLWFPCQSALMEVTVVMLVLISSSRTVAGPSSVCSAPADQETTAALNIEYFYPVSKEYAQGDSLSKNSGMQLIHTFFFLPQVGLALLDHH